MTEIKKFLTSVGDVEAFDENDVLLFSAKTLLDTNLDVKVSPTEVRGGRGAPLLFTYYHSGALSLALTDTQFNLQLLGSTVGSNIATGNNIYQEETITLGAAGTGTVVGTPLAVQTSTVYGWVKQLNGTIERVTFSGSTFATSSGTSGDVVCCRYYALNSASRSVTIPANILPKIVRLVVSAQLNSSDVASNKIGIMQLTIPKFSLSGTFALQMKSDGVSSTPLSGMAYASTDLTTAACSNVPIFAKIVEILDNANVWDGVTALAINGGDFALTHPSTRTLVVYAIRSGDAPFVIPNSYLDCTSGTAGTATITLHGGVVSTVASGTTLLRVAITAAPLIDATCLLTVS